eukprot:m.18195 g.18195  ORF g.18195 m.18195 type:complete len:327 (+) comp5664_c0_seq1:135-1115(+)
MSSVMALVLVACLVACTAALPTLPTSPPHHARPAAINATSSLGAIPTGAWDGAFSIVPYTGSPGAYSCMGCTVSAPFYVLFFANAQAELNISNANTNGCPLSRQSYTLYGIQPYSDAYPHYYAAKIRIAGADVPVCFYFGPNTAGSYNFVITLDGLGTCPNAGAPASCSPSHIHGAVSQTWSGVLNPAKLPTGKFNGHFSQSPYLVKNNKAVCECPAINMVASYTFNPADKQLTITASGGASGACTIPSITHVIRNLDVYPNGYYGGVYTVPQSSITFPTCFLFANNQFTWLVDSIGNCPASFQAASCTNNPYGTLPVQVNSGQWQ